MDIFEIFYIIGVTIGIAIVAAIIGASLTVAAFWVAEKIQGKEGEK